MALALFRAAQKIAAHPAAYRGATHITINNANRYVRFALEHALGKEIRHCRHASARALAAIVPSCQLLVGEELAIDAAALRYVIKTNRQARAVLNCGFGAVRVAQLELHVALTGRNPYLANHHVLVMQKNVLAAYVQNVWSAHRLSGQSCQP